MTFDLNPALGKLSVENGTTDGSGRLKTVYTAPSAQEMVGSDPNASVNVEARIPPCPRCTSYAFQQIWLLTYFLSMDISPFEIVANGVAQAAVKVHAEDYDRNPVPGEGIGFDTPAIGQLSALAANTGPDGSATVFYTARGSELAGKKSMAVPIRATNAGHYSTATASVQVVNNAPVIKDVRTRYLGTMLQGVSAPNRYFVTVDWLGDPGYVEFDLNGKVSRVDGDATGAVKDYDTGVDMDASVWGGSNVLMITAFNKDGRLQSQPVVLKPLVVGAMGWLDAAALTLYPFTAGESGVAAALQIHLEVPGAASR